MEEIRKIEQTVVDMKCPICKSGHMRPNGIVPSAEQYEHKCTVCPYIQTYGMRFPYTV